ncbi:hypothetical protein KEU06_16080 [Pseudaminobacter sp. 19-2017]|uniref:Uncharacterized protein n=1 Tax=Pseudaminobacter soli (ex Zhang et al. 2022) TaxID=2831468 RepID=A0A942I2S4_9HYPH|nr:hypothetical protein [Pseudaminobacter soli]MBS3650132.1 hypothetical protein [Pseudaminobacter soli]
MSENSAKGLWATAAVASLLLHGSIGMALYAMPIPEPRKQSRTEIDVATLMGGAATQSTSTEKAVIGNAPGEVAVVEPRDQASAAAEAAPVLAAAQPEAHELGSSSPLAVLEPVSSSAEPAIVAPDALAREAAAKKEAIAAALADQVAPSELPAEAAPVASSEATRSAEIAKAAAGDAQPEAAQVADPLSTPDQPKLAAAAQVEAPSEAVLPAASASIQPAPAPQTATETSEVSARTVPTEAPRLAYSAQTVEPAIRNEIEAIASLNESTPTISLSEVAIAAESETAAPPSLESAPAQPSQPAQAGSEALAASNKSVIAVAKTRRNGGALAAASSAPPASILPVSPQPSLGEAGLAAVAPEPETIVAIASPAHPDGVSPEEAIKLGQQLASVGQVIDSPATRQSATPTDESAAAEEISTAIAALPRTSVTVDDRAGAAEPNRLPITDFLAENEYSDCLLAIPTGTGPTAASIEAFAVEKSAVEQLGAEYQRLSGIPVTADTRPVSQDQCSALAFARSLAQYPNFPLRVALAKPVIESGQELVGVVSGLRKDTIYLVVVDDEGKAELASSYSGQREPVVDFSAPMTLTSGPVSSVQLLIAIASDGPLRTVPHRPGMPAEDFFSKLATEIVVGQRSVAFGMTSFVVK